MSSSGAYDPGPSANAFDVPLSDTIAVRSSGLLILVARAANLENTTLYFNVSKPTLSADAEPGNWSGWYRFYFPDHPDLMPENVRYASELPPAELRVAGMDLITVTPAAHRGDPANAPFRVIAIDQTLYCFRPSKDGTLYLNRLTIIEKPSDADDSHQTPGRETGPPIYQMEQMWEARFRASGEKDTPEGDRDSQSVFDPNNNPFLEPTLELTADVAVGEVFDVVAVPTVDPKITRIYIASSGLGKDGSSDVVKLWILTVSDGGQFDLSELGSTIEIPLALKTGDNAQVALQALKGQAPALAFYYEQNSPIATAAATPKKDESSLQDGRLAIAVPVGNDAIGLPRAMAIYDFGIKEDGTIPTSFASPAVLVDGTLSDGHFTKKTATGFPTPDQALQTIHVIDRLTISAMVLGQVQPQRSPLFFAGSDGLLHLYFAGPDAPLSFDGSWGGLIPGEPTFQVAQYNSRSQRSVIDLSWVDASRSERPQGTVRLLARRAGPTMNDTSVSVAAYTDADDEAGTHPDLCTVTINYGGTAVDLPTEVWQGVPRDLRAFMRVMNGETIELAGDPRVRVGQSTFFDPTGSFSQVRIKTNVSATGDTPGQNGQEPFPAALTLVSSRTDLKLQSVNVSDGSTADTATLVLKVGSNEGGCDLTFKNVSRQITNLPDILSGSDPRYSYAPTVPLMILRTDSEDGEDAIIFYPKPDHQPSDLSGLAIHVESNQADATKCDLSIKQGANSLSLTGICRAQADFISAIQQHEGWNQFQLLISPGPLPGDVVDQQIEKPSQLAGASVLFDVLLPAADLSARIVNGVYGTIVQQRTPVSTRTERGMVALYALLGTLPESGGDQYVVLTTDGPARPTIDGQASVWQTRQETYDLTFNASSRMNVPIEGQGQPLASRANLAPDMDWTFETWIRPLTSNLQTVATYHAASTKTAPGQPTADYAIGTTGANSLQFAAVKTSPPVRKSTYLTTGTDQSLLLNTSFTWEFWVQPDAAAAPSSPATSLGYALMVVDVQSPNPNFAVGLNHDRKVVVRYTKVGTQPRDITSKLAIAANDNAGDPVWSHVAVVVERAPAGGPSEGKATISIVIDGALDSTAEVDLGRFTTLPRANIGGIGVNDASLAGRLGSMRFWTTTRSIQQIRSYAFRSLGGNEHGLAGLWSLDVDVPVGGEIAFENRAESTGKKLDAILILSTNQEWKTVPSRFLLSLVAGVGGAPIEIGSAVLLSNRWNHLAVVYRAGGGLRLRGRSASGGKKVYDFAYEENKATFGFNDRCAIDAWVQLSAESKGNANSIIGRWSSEDSGQEFELFIDESGAFAARFVITKDIEGNPYEVKASGGANLLAPDAGGAYPVRHVAARLVLTNTLSQDNESTTGVYKLELRIDNQEVAISTNIATPFAGRTTRLQVRITETRLSVGMRALPTQPWESLDIGDHAFFHGVIGETRVWLGEPTWPQLFPECFTDRMPEIAPPGLIARWGFREQRGLTAYDLARDDNLRLSSTDLWTQVKATSVQELYANGGRVWDTRESSSLRYSSTDQFTLGQRTEGGDGFLGALTQVRIWREARTPDQILENLYCQLKGDEPNLTAFWSFDAGADKKPNAQDHTGGGNNANPEPDQSRFLVSDAPVSNEGPEVFNTYGGVVTDFQVTTKIRPAVAEMVGASIDRDGVPTGKLRRQYVFEDPVASLPAPFKVGDLDLNFIGQVQTNAKLIGYIEGAPPVPSENLTLPYFDSTTGFGKYDGSSAVTLVQTGETSISYSSGRQTASDISTKGSAGPFWKFQKGVVYGIGVGLEIQDFMVEGKFVVTTGHEFKWGSGVDNTYASSWTDKATDSLRVSGSWEPPDSILNPTVGRRYRPNNLGTALVESLVADSFAIRDARTGAMLGVILIPNLAIPPDRNIVTFPIWDKYTKQGTLDGKVGFVDDPSSTNVDQARGSYFKPAEAYALKSQLEQSTARDQAFYRQFDARGRGQTEFTADLSGVTKNLPIDFEADTVRRGLVNSYVWSADGGYHAEEQSYLARVSHSYKGFFHRANRGGFDLESTFVFFVGMKGALSFSGGLQVDVNVGSTDQKSLAFGLTSMAEGERYLHSWQPATETMKGHYSVEPAPGKVRAYRFMTFYLPPSEKAAEGFANIVDPIWLKRSTDAAAVVLRSADTSNPAWRIFHRVTYVERVPPSVSDEPVTSKSSSVSAPVNLKGNVALLALIKAELATGSPSPAQIGRAIQRVLNPAPNAGGSYPKATLESVVPWWGAFLAKARPGQQQQADAAALLSRIFTNVLTYVKNGYASGVIQSDS